MPELHPPEYGVSQFPEAQLLPELSLLTFALKVENNFLFSFELQLGQETSACFKVDL